ncbi:endonuclease [Flavobacterium sp. RHBU_3]|uniref:endonuclease n=1 Tax=Flavobacterium sp. RHBU_3 TaxID=3391184 RepID=UPI0039852F37
MKKLLLLISLPFLAAAQVPQYYSSIDFSLTGDALKAQLATLITDTHTTELVYTPGAWDALVQTDLDPTNSENVLLVYGYDDTDTDVSTDRTRDKDLSCHTSSCTGLWVREHVYPRSLGNPNLEFEGPGSDAHHLRAIDNSMNGSRSNRIFADGSGNATTLPNDQFYPGDEWKGDVARMMMYMYVRYNTQCEATVVGAGDTSYSTYGDMPNIFLEWNEEDPVSYYETNRNDVLQQLQGNRNPFIDNPYLANRIWNGPQAEDTWGLLATVTNKLNNIYLYPTCTNDEVHIMNTEGEKYNYALYNMLGQQIPISVTNGTFSVEKNAPGMYFLTITNGKTVKILKLIHK